MGASKTLGIIGICTGWAFPIVGLILGIIGLSIKKDKEKTLNIISIIEGLIVWIYWAYVYWAYVLI